MKAFSGMKGYRAEMPLQHWLSRIAMNTCYDHLRRIKREKQIFQPALPAGVMLENFSALDDAGAWRKEESRLFAEQILSRLPAADRLVLTLMVLEEMSSAEVAKATGWSIANVKIRAFRARSRIRKLLGQANAEMKEGG